MRNGQARGFTLIEIMIVIGIIGILAIVVVPQYAKYRTQAQDMAAKSALRNLAVAENTYYYDEQHYTKTRSDLKDFWTVEGNIIVTILNADSNSWSATAHHVSSTHTWTYSSIEGGLR